MMQTLTKGDTLEIGEFREEHWYVSGDPAENAIVTGTFNGDLKSVTVCWHDTLHVRFFGRARLHVFSGTLLGPMPEEQANAIHRDRHKGDGCMTCASG